jgi:ubiquinone/menaquinone biosynthesis C-methylase UbiE
MPEINNQQRKTHAMAGVKQQVAQQFGQAAEAYRTSSVHASGIDLPRMVELAELRGDERVLDAGCGAGHAAATFAPHVRAVLAVDLSAQMLAVAAALAAERGLTNISVRQGDVDALPAEDGAFDLVVSRYSAHHWPHPQQGLREIHRVLKPDGRFILSDIVSFSDFTADSYLQTIEVLRDPSHVRDHTVAQWRAMLAEAGFSVHTVWDFDCWLAFEPWVARIGTSATNIAALRALMSGAPGEVQQALRIEASGAFTLPAAVFVAQRVLNTL